MSNHMEHSHLGIVISLTDDNGVAHNARCANNAIGSLHNEAGLNGYFDAEDMAASWTKEYSYPYTVEGILRTWLSDGTVECDCED